MWISSMLLALSYVVLRLTGSDEHTGHKVILILFFTIQAIGFGGYQTNIVQFGVDQLTDASTTEITSFVAWYAWFFFSSRITATFIDLLIQNISAKIIICLH